MLIKIKHYLSRFDLKDALVLSILIHGILITDLLILKFDDAKKNKESIDFEAVLLSKNIPEPLPPSEEQASEKPESEVSEEIETEVPEENSVPVKKEITPTEPEPAQQQESSVSAPEPVEVPEIGEDDSRNAGLIALDDFSRQLQSFARQMGQADSHDGKGDRGLYRRYGCRIPDLHADRFRVWVGDSTQ